MSKESNGSGKEVDRLLLLIEKIARVDTKLDEYSKQYIIDERNIKDVISLLQDDIEAIETKCDEILIKYTDIKIDFNELKSSYDKQKWIWSAASIIIAPILTTIIIIVINRLAGGMIF